MWPMNKPEELKLSLRMRTIYPPADSGAMPGRMTALLDRLSETTRPVDAEDRRRRNTEAMTANGSESATRSADRPPPKPEPERR